MSTDALPSALVESIREDAYPDSADVASAEVTEDAVKSSLALVKQEKEALEVGNWSGVSGVSNIVL